MSKDNKQLASNFNLATVSSEEFERCLESTFEAEANIAVFGRRGSGKTQISKSAIRKFKYDFGDGRGKRDCKEVYINLSVFERPDMGGYPNMFKDGKYVDFKHPSFYEPMMEGDTPVICLLDEVDKAEPSLWAPLLEFTQFRSINKIQLPNLKAVIMTGNLISEGGSRPCMPLLDRVTKFLIEPNAADWLSWSAKEGGIHPSITAFIHDNQSELYGAVDPDNSYADPSPRSWEIASNLIKKGEERHWSNAQTIKMVCGAIGNQTGLKYSVYFDHYIKIVPFVNKVMAGADIKEIMKEYDALKPTEQMVASMQVCSRLSTLIDKHLGSGKTVRFGAGKSKLPEELDKGLSNSANFLSKLSVEIFLIGFRTQLTIKKLLEHQLDDHEDFGPKVLDKARNQIKGLSK